LFAASSPAQNPPSLHTLHSFGGGSDGASPYSESLAVGCGGVLYGTTQAGGTSNDGTVFALTPPRTPGGSWSETVLHSFNGSDGTLPSEGVVIGPGGVLYGTTDSGGTSNYGVVFSLTPSTPSGDSCTERTLYNFAGGSDGAHPRQLVIGLNGLYGTTDGYVAGASAMGTVFSLTPPASPGGSWTETTLYTFAGGSDGATPYTGLVIGAGGVLYGTTFYGGTANGGTVFTLTPPASRSASWTEDILHTFTGGSDGSGPYAGVVIGSDGVLYGTTQYGGAAGRGTVFSLTPPASEDGAWTENVLHSFAGREGAGPVAGIAIGPRGVLYTTT